MTLPFTRKTDASMRCMMLIINPISGNGDKRGMAERIAATLGAQGIKVDIAYTERPGHATELAAKGAAIMMVSPDLNELLQLCDRILLFADGRIVRDITAADAQPDEVYKILNML